MTMLEPLAPPIQGHVRVLRTARPRQVVERVLAVIPPHAWLDRAVFWLMYDTQLRVVPLCRLTLADVDIQSSLPLVRCGERWRILTERPTVTALADYLPRRARAAAFLFSHAGRPLDLAYLDQRWRSYGQQAGVSCTLRELRGG